MKFGICTGPENAVVIEDAGFDYIELNVVGNLRPFEPDDTVMPQLEQLLAMSGLRSEAMNGMVPGDLPLVGSPDRLDLERQRQYLTSAFARAKRVGCEVVVFGSGVARNVPEGFSKSAAEIQIVSFLAVAGDIAGEHNIDIAIEPLNRVECNIINSVSEGAEIAARVNHPRVKVLSDLYHVGREEQSYDETANAGSTLAHVHVARPSDRFVPVPEDEPMLIDYFKAVRRAGYSGRISIEAGWPSGIETSAGDVLKVLQEAWRLSDSKSETAVR